jgi:hypothetical protein
MVGEQIFLGAMRCNEQEEPRMPIHFRDLDLAPQVAGLQSALIVPCIMCPAVTVAIREDRPFMNFFRSFFKSAPFERYLDNLQTQLRTQGLKTELFKSRLYHHWFLCMWSARRRRKLERRVQGFDAVIVLGCSSATETVRDTVQSAGCKVIEGMEFGGLTNAKLKIKPPAKVSFDAVKIVPLSRQVNAPGPGPKPEPGAGR